MRLQYFPANGAWAFTFGDALIRMRDAEMFFRKRSDAVAEAKRAGLTVERNGSIRVTGKQNPYGPRAKYRHKRIRSPRRFVRKSLRLTPERKGVRVVVGRLKGERRRVKR